MMSGEKHLIALALEFRTESLMGHMHGLSTEWRATFKRRLADEAIGLVPSLQKTAIIFIEE